VSAFDSVWQLCMHAVNLLAFMLHAVCVGIYESRLHGRPITHNLYLAAVAATFHADAPVDLLHSHAGLWDQPNKTTATARLRCPRPHAASQASQATRR
jgi:hypothetical protein